MYTYKSRSRVILTLLIKLICIAIIHKVAIHGVQDFSTCKIYFISLITVLSLFIAIKISAKAHRKILLINSFNEKKRLREVTKDCND